MHYKLLADRVLEIEAKRKYIMDHYHREIILLMRGLYQMMLFL